MPAVGRLSGTPASISASEEPHTVAIDDEPFEFGDLRDDADRVGELGGGRQHRVDGAPGELAMSDFAPAGRAHTAGLADRIGREVVVEQEALLIRSLERVDVLLVLAGAERRHHQGLRLAAREQGRAVSARQNADLGEDGPDRRQIAPVDAALMVEDVPAHDLGLGIVESLGHRLGGEFGLAALREQLGGHLRLDRVDGGVALLLLGDRIGGAQIRFADCEHRLLDRGLVDGFELARLLGGLFGEADDRLDHRLERGVARHHRLEHRLFGKLLGLQFDHQDRVGGAGDDEVERRFLLLLDGREDLDLVLDETDARPADRAHERHARQGERRRGGDQGENVRIVLHVVAEYGGDDLGVAAEIVGEQRPDRAVDQARGQRLLVGHAPFALEIAAGDAPRREGLFLIVNREREEIDARFGRLHGDHGRQNSGFAPAGEHRAVGLPRNAAGFENELATA